MERLVPIPQLSLILGHEVVGEVVEVGEDVRKVKVGERAVPPWICYIC